MEISVDESTRIAELMERAETLVSECEAIDHGEADIYGPEVSVERLDRMLGLARSVSPRFRSQTEDMTSLAESSRIVDQTFPWLSDNPALIRTTLDQLKGNLGAVRGDLAHRKWELWLKTIKDNSQRSVLRETWPILEKAQGPLTRKQIESEFRACPDWSILGKALAAAATDGLLVNRKKKPQGYFITHMFPHLIDPSK